MIKVFYGSNIERSSTVVDANTTLKDFCNSFNLPYESKLMMLDGVTLTADDINKTFAQMGIVDDCIFITVPKQDNA